MVDSDSDWRQAGGLSLLELPLVPEVPTMEIPIALGEEMPWVEPRRYGADGPVWDATDEIYITYDEEGERAVVTTGERDIWNREHSYQRTGSGRYSALRSLGGRVGDAGRRIRRGWNDATNRDGWPQVHVDRPGDGPGGGPRGGARTGPEDDGARAHGPARHLRDRTDRRRVSERSDGAHDEPRARSHRHCPGCSGHSRVLRSGWGIFGRGVAGWFIGWLAIFFGGVGLTLPQYVILTALGFTAAMIFRPVWREFADAEGRRAKGGRR